MQTGAPRLRHWSLVICFVICGEALAAERFLDAAETDLLAPHPQVPGVSRHVTPGVDLNDYDNLIIGGVSFYFAENSKTKQIDADEMKQIADVMKAAMISAAADKRRVVLTPDAHTALINIALTDLNMHNKKRGLLGYTPIGLVVTTAGNLSGMRVELRDAGIEGEVVDSTNGEVLTIFRVDSIGNWDDEKRMSWDDLRSTLEDSFGKALAALSPDATE